MQTLKNTQTKTPESTIRPELELLLCCAHARLDSRLTEQIKVLARSKLDWHFLIQQAAYHKVLPLLYTNLQAICPEAVPAAALPQLHDIFHTAVQQNLLLAGELVRVLSCLGNHEIVAVPYQGPVLANLVYGNVILRPCSHLDLIVQQQDILNVKQLLLALGYRPRLEMTCTQEIAYLDSKTERTYDFFHPEQQTAVVLHCRIELKHSTVIEPKHFWHNLELTDFAGATIVNLPLEDWLSILCVHASQSLWERLIWICDIAELLQAQPQINWQKIMWQAHQLGCKRTVLVGLYLTHHLLGTNLPPEIMQQIAADRQAELLASKIRSNFVHSVNADQEFLGTARYHIQIRERFQDKISYCRSLLQGSMKLTR